MILLAALFLPMSAAAVEDPGLTCRNAILIDATYDEVLYDKGAYDKVYPASITKVMTALLVLEAVDAGELTLDTPITATAEALEVPEGSSTAKFRWEIPTPWSSTCTACSSPRATRWPRSWPLRWTGAWRPLWTT